MIIDIGTLMKELKRLLKKARKTKGAADVASILVVAISLVVFVAMLPLFSITINDALSTVDSATGILLRLIPFVMVILIMLIPTN